MWDVLVAFAKFKDFEEMGSIVKKAACSNCEKFFANIFWTLFFDDLNFVE